MTLPVVLDFVVLIVLVGTLSYAVMLNRRLNALSQSRQELTNFLASFTASIAKAENSVKELKNTGETTFAAAENLVQKASILKDELSFLLERGNHMAEKLDDGIRLARQEQAILEEMTALQKNTPPTGIKEGVSQPNPLKRKTVKGAGAGATIVGTGAANGTEAVGRPSRPPSPTKEEAAILKRLKNVR